MGSVLNRTTKSYQQSVNTPDYPVAEWIHEPDLTAVEGEPSKYWVITGDTVTLMSQVEMDALDAAELQAQRDQTSARIDELEDIIRAQSLTLLDELNMHAERVNGILTAIDSSTTLAQVKTAVALIEDIPTRTIQQLKNALRSKLGT